MTRSTVVFGGYKTWPMTLAMQTIHRCERFNRQPEILVNGISIDGVPSSDRYIMPKGVRR
jgi:hypothetical protein